MAVLEGSISSDPAVDAKQFTPTDDVTLSMNNIIERENNFPKAFIVDVDGVLAIKNVNEDIIEIPVLAGVIYPILAIEYRATLTVGPTKVIGLV